MAILPQFHLQFMLLFISHAYGVFDIKLHVPEHVLQGLKSNNLVIFFPKQYKNVENAKLNQL